MDSFKFQFAQVEKALARMHEVDDQKRSAFQGRLKHNQKQHFPPGTNTGRGKAAAYSPRHAVQMAVLLEMNQVGLTPDRAMKLSLAHMPRIQRAIYLATSKILTDDEEPLLIVFDPIALSDLRGDVHWDETEATFDINTESEFKARIGDDTNLRSRRYALINVSAVVDELCHQLAEASEIDETELMRAVCRSADEEDWRDGNP